MFSTPTPTSGSRTIVNNALRNAGLIDRDAQMRDVGDKPGGRKSSSKSRSHRPRAIDAFKDHPSGLSKSMLASRISSHAGPSDPLSIRGASRPTVAGRLRRNAVSGSGGGPGSNTSTTQPIIRVSTSKYKAVEPWRELVQKRWNSEARFLDLGSLIDDEVVKKHNLSPPGHGGTPRDAAVIFKLAAQLQPEVQTLSLANNNLTGHHLTYLSRYLPRLANLSLQNNNLRGWKDLEFISPRKERMMHIRELILLGNPLREQEFQAGRGEQYKREMARRFSSLEVLDQEAIAQISFDVPQPSTSSAAVKKPTATTFPFEMGPSFITGVDGSLVSNFLVRFYNTLDNQRAALVDVYGPTSTFSFSANTNIPARARIEGFHSSRDMPNQRKLEWTPWLSGGIGGSRNLSRIGGGGGLDKTVKSLHIGGEEVVKALLELPGTRHDIGGPPEKFSVDSFPVVHGEGMGLLLVIHGQFTEVGAEGIRSFDRSFVLAPAPDGSRAKLNGWDVVVLSDQWIIRGYSNHEAWKPGPMLVQAQSRQQPPQSTPTPSASQNQTATAVPPPPPGLSLPLDQQATLAAIPEIQQNLVLQICTRTGLNVKFAIDCLTGNGWDIERAVANFNEVKGTLSRDAFL